MTTRPPLAYAPTVPHSSAVWGWLYPTPAIPASGRSSDLLPAGRSCKPPVDPSVPWVLPFFPDGTAVDAETQAFLDGRQMGVTDGRQLVLLSQARADFNGGFTLTNYTGFTDGQYGGSTGFELPWPPGASGVFVHGAFSVSGHIMQTADNIYQSPGESDWPCHFQVGGTNDREFPYRGLIADPSCTPALQAGEGSSTEIFPQVHSLFTPHAVTYSGDSPGWASPGYHGFEFTGSGFTGFAGSNSGTLTLTANLVFAWYGFIDAPVGFDPTAGFQPPLTINSSDRGGCC